MPPPSMRTYYTTSDEDDDSQFTYRSAVIHNKKPPQRVFDMINLDSEKDEETTSSNMNDYVSYTLELLENREENFAKRKLKTLKPYEALLRKY